MRVTVLTDLGRETHQGLVTEIQTHLGLEAEVAHVSKVSMLNCMLYTCKGCVPETEAETETETETGTETETETDTPPGRFCRHDPGPSLSQNVCLCAYVCVRVCMCA